MPKPTKKAESTVSLSLDAKDIAILKLLQQNARATVKAVSYTHLDVYKRQMLHFIKLKGEL